MNYKEIYRRPPITDREWVMPFGKHKGKTIAYLMDADPQYLAWCIERDMIELDHILLDEFEQLNPWMIDA